MSEPTEEYCCCALGIPTHRNPSLTNQREDPVYLSAQWRQQMETEVTVLHSERPFSQFHGDILYISNTKAARVESRPVSIWSLKFYIVWLYRISFMHGSWETSYHNLQGHRKMRLIRGIYGIEGVGNMVWTRISSTMRMCAFVQRGGMEVNKFKSGGTREIIVAGNRALISLLMDGSTRDFEKDLIWAKDGYLHSPTQLRISDSRPGPI